MIKLVRQFLKFIWAEESEYIYLISKYNRLVNKEVIYNYREW